MTAWIRNVSLMTLTFLLALPGLALAAGGSAEHIVIVADSRKLEGIMAWWANMYNESHLEFTIITVIVIPVIGVIFGVATDFVMNHIGIDLKSRDLAEH